MQHGIEAVLAHDAPHERRIRQVTFDEHGSHGEGLAMALLKVVEHHHPGAALDERADAMASDIARPAGHEQRGVHDVISTAGFLRRTGWTSLTSARHPSLR